ncbi:MAG: iron-sulfur cluster assembly scaffold protein [Patescibacteria group bacterium]|nr:iron-sulfur cluster assembly scaffold protein [Patescibacteria group bacterium]
MTKNASTTGLYTKKAIKCFTNPKNYGRIKNPDGIGKVGNPVCGDVMWLYLKIGKKGRKEYIEDVKFETFGCVAAIATSSILTDLVKGKTLQAALKIDNQKIVKSLGGLPPIKLHCSVLAANALKKAVEDYQKQKEKKKSK